MLCYKNGALAREKIRDLHAGGDWMTFNQLVESTPPGNNGYMALYYPLPEIIPANVTGEYLFSCRDPGIPESVDSIPSIAGPRAILESQLLSVLSRIEDILPDGSPRLRRLVVSGGSSINETILQTVADIFGTPVFVASGPASTEAACIGGAMLALHARNKQSGKKANTPSDALHRVIQPRDGRSEGYRDLLEVYRACEAEAVRLYGASLVGDRCP